MAKWYATFTVEVEASTTGEAGIKANEAILRRIYNADYIEPDYLWTSKPRIRPADERYEVKILADGVDTEIIDKPEFVDVVIEYGPNNIRGYIG